MNGDCVRKEFWELPFQFSKARTVQSHQNRKLRLLTGTSVGGTQRLQGLQKVSTLYGQLYSILAQVSFLPNVMGEKVIHPSDVVFNILSHPGSSIIKVSRHTMVERSCVESKRLQCGHVVTIALYKKTNHRTRNYFPCHLPCHFDFYTSKKFTIAIKEYIFPF